MPARTTLPCCTFATFEELLMRTGALYKLVGVAWVGEHNEWWLISLEPRLAQNKCIKARVTQVS